MTAPYTSCSPVIEVTSLSARSNISFYNPSEHRITMEVFHSSAKDNVRERLLHLETRRPIFKIYLRPSHKQGMHLQSIWSTIQSYLPLITSPIINYWPPRNWQPGQGPPWMISSLETSTAGGVTTVTTTSPTQCNLTLRILSRPAFTTKEQRYKRGKLWRELPILMLPWKTEVSPNESGDTLTRTHSITGYPVGTDLQIYFLGSVYGLPSPSRSQIFDITITNPVI